MALDVVLFEEAPKNKTAECCLSFIMGLKDYAPRLSAEQLATLGDKFDKWRQTADPFIVADKMAEFWCMKQNFQAILNTLSRVLDTENTQNRNDWARELLKMLAGSDVYASAVTMLLRKGIACPFDFKVLLDKKDSTNVDCNLNLCIYQKLEGRIPENIFELLSPEQQKKLLVARANKGTLTENMLSKVSDATIKNELLDILEEKAQEKWFKPLLNYDIKNEDVAILAHSHIKGKLYPSLLDLTFQDKKWVHVFIEKGWYDTRHLIMLMKSAYVTEIEFFFTHGKMSQPLYEALLTGPNANLAPKAKYYLQIEDNTPAQTKALI